MLRKTLITGWKFKMNMASVRFAAGDSNRASNQFKFLAQGQQSLWAGFKMRFVATKGGFSIESRDTLTTPAGPRG